MDRTKRVALGVVVVVGLVGGAVVVQEFFLPEQSTRVSEPTAESPESDSTTLARGTFEGRTGHTVRGTVELRRDAEGLYLRFEDYEQTQGPDVFVYLTPSPDPTTREEIAEGRKILIDGGADGGESTKEGTFTQRLPADLDPTRYGGVGVWCEDFGVPFGTAALNATGN